MKEIFREQGNPNIHEPTNLGFSSPQPEPSPYGGGTMSPESQPLPGVWDILERSVRLEVIDAEGQIGHEAYNREFREVGRLKSELMEKGNARDKLILELYSRITIQPLPTPPAPVEIIDLSPQEFQQFRSKVESLDEEQLTEQIRRAEERFERKSDEMLKKGKEQGGWPPRGLAMP